MTTNPNKLLKKKRLDFKNISNMIEFNDWLKKNIDLYKAYDYDENVPKSHIKQYLMYLLNLVTKDPKAKNVFKRKEWEDQINKLLKDEVGELVGR